MELTLTTNTIRGNPRSQLEEDEEGRSGARFHSVGVIPVACAPSFAVFEEDGEERRRAECSGEIEANCGFNATRGTQAISFTDTCQIVGTLFAAITLGSPSKPRIGPIFLHRGMRISRNLGPLSFDVMSRICGNKARPSD